MNLLYRLPILSCCCSCGMVPNTNSCHPLWVRVSSMRDCMSTLRGLEVKSAARFPQNGGLLVPLGWISELESLNLRLPHPYLRESLISGETPMKELSSRPIILAELKTTIECRLYRWTHRRSYLDDDILLYSLGRKYQSFIANLDVTLFG